MRARTILSDSWWVTTGIGKTTVLQHVHRLGSAYLSDRAEDICRIHVLQPREIRDAAAWTSNFCGELRAAAEKIRKDWEIPAVTDDDLANFILVNSPRVLYGVEAPINTNNSELVRLLFQRNRRHYELEYLKLLTCTPGASSIWARICIVVDDIEALSHQVQLFAVKQLLQSHLCLQHNQGRKVFGIDRHRCASKHLCVSMRRT